MEIVRYIIIVGFLLAGAAKVLRAKPMVDQFSEFGLPPYLVVVVGSLEILGAIGLLVPGTWVGILAIIGLIILMIGAVSNHIKFKHNVQTIAPAFILGFLSSVYLYFLLS